jgi:hypothetical protein
MIGRADKKRETRTQKRMMAIAAGAHRIDRKAGEVDRLAVDQESRPTLPSQIATPLIAGRVADKVVFPEDQEVLQGWPAPRRARAEATHRDVAGDLRNNPSKRDGDLLHRSAAPLPGKMIAGDHGGLPGAVRRGVARAEVVTGAPMHGVPVADLGDNLGNRGGVLRAGQTTVVRGLPEAVPPGVALLGGQIGALAPGIVRRDVARQAVAAHLP